MKILVCISVVPDTTSRISFIEDRLDIEDVQFVINPTDELALNKALDLKEKDTSSSVTVIHVGGVESEPIIRKILAIGVDEVIRVNVDANNVDANMVANEISKVSSDYDLILTGKESIDYNGGITHALIAAKLGYTHISNCISLDLLDDKAIITRELWNTYENITSSLPLVIAVQKGIIDENKLRVPNMRGIMNARKRKIEMLTAMSIERKIQDANFELRVKKRKVKMINVQELADILQNNMDTH